MLCSGLGLAWIIEVLNKRIDHEGKIMTKDRLWKRLGKALGKEVEETPEDIDREIESAVKAIKEAEVSSLSTDEVFDGARDDADGKAFVMDLAPVFATIGSRSERIVAANELICERVFADHVSRGSGRASFEGECFVMRFSKVRDDEAFRLAMDIVNTIGTQILGDRFHSMELPGLVVVAEAGDIMDKDGSLNPDKVRTVVDGGGIAVAMEEPPETAPEWMRLLWKSQLSSTIVRAEGAEARPSEQVWQRGDDGALDPGAAGWRSLDTAAAKGEVAVGGPAKPRRELDGYAKRKSEERRRISRPFAGTDRRKAFDRRGRGH